MRMTSSERSLRLCAFSVLSARICQATSRVGTTSAVIAFAPSRRIAARRCRRSGSRTRRLRRGAVIAMSGSRKRPVFWITSARRLWCVSQRSRWNGVGSTFVDRQTANTRRGRRADRDSDRSPRRLRSRPRGELIETRDLETRCRVEPGGAGLRLLRRFSPCRGPLRCLRRRALLGCHGGARGYHPRMRRMVFGVLALLGCARQERDETGATTQAVFTDTTYLPTARSSAALLTLAGGDAFLVGGYDGTAYVSSIDVWSRTTGLWSNGARSLRVRAPVGRRAGRREGLRRRERRRDPLRPRVEAGELPDDDGAEPRDHGTLLSTSKVLLAGVSSRRRGTRRRGCSFRRPRRSRPPAPWRRCASRTGSCRSPAARSSSAARTTIRIAPLF